MKSSRKGNKLSFHKETVRVLHDSALSHVAGGMKASGSLQSNKTETCMCSTECLGACHTADDQTCD